jgi:hypothetical protein
MAVGAAAVLLAAGGVKLWVDDTKANPDRTHAMTELTAKMKPFCFGRYLVDVPADAEVALASAEFGMVKIERVAGYDSEDEFRNSVAAREESLRAGTHATEGSKLRSSKSVGGAATRLLVYRTEEKGTYVSTMEMLVSAPRSVAWLLKAEVADEDVASASETFISLGAVIEPRDMSVVPKIAGGCVHDGIVKIATKDRETYRGEARNQSLSWSISFLSETSGAREKAQGLLARVDRAIDMAGSSSNIKRIRHAPIKLDGRNGEEAVGLYPTNDAMVLDAKLELYGNKTPQQPTIKVHMEVGWPNKPSASDPRKFLDQKQALEIWDAVIKSLRPRPGAF